MMSRYRISDQAAPLAALLVDVDTEVAGAHETMRERVKKACEVHNAAIRLCLGEGEFADDWDKPAPLNEEGTLPPFDPGKAMPLVESILIELRSKQSPHASLDAELVRDRVHRLALMDVEHPLVVHFRTLHARCYPYSDNPPGWFETVVALQAAGK